jgi:hypothetical protein
MVIRTARPPWTTDERARGRRVASRNGRQERVRRVTSQDTSRPSAAEAVVLPYRSELLRSFPSRNQVSFEPVRRNE